MALYISFEKAIPYLFLSGVYGFNLDEMQEGTIQLIPYDQNNQDPHLAVKFESSGRVGFGADGVTIDGEGNLYTSVIEDGIINKTTLDERNKPIQTELFAQDGNMNSADGIVWNEADNKIYVADFLGNGVHSVDMSGKVQTLHKNGDTNGANGLLDEPCEVIVRGNELIIVNMDMPIELSKDEINDIVTAFGERARRAKAWGFDAVQLHGAHGFLINQFLSPLTNRRMDEYGGSMENRCRFLVEVYENVRETVGAEYPVLIKLNAADHVDGGLEIDDAVYAAKKLSGACIDAI